MKKWICSLMIVVFFAMFGCSTPWQAKTTAGYVSGTTLAGTAETAVKPSCDAVAIPADRCVQLQTIYGSIRQGLVSAGNTLILAFSVTDAVQQQTLLQNYDTIMVNVQDAIKSYIDLYTSIKSAQKMARITGKKVPLAVEQYAISPELLAIIINSFIAIVQNIPQIMAAVNSWNINTVDIPALTAQVKSAQANLPVW